MARTPVLERTATRRTLGIGFLALLVLGVWLTYGVFNKTFVSSVDIAVASRSAGLQLNENSDVKLRGVFVGSVKDIELAPDGDGVMINVRIDPEYAGDIPDDVEAAIVPKTLFGEKYVDLQDQTATSTTSISDGDVIEVATMPAEVERLLNDIYPLLRAVKPADLNTTLTAIANALEGRGDLLGRTFVRTDRYLGRLQPLTPTLVTDLKRLGRTADVYADAMPDLGDFLRNTTVTASTLLEKREQIDEVYSTLQGFSSTTQTFFEEDGDPFVRLMRDQREVLPTLADYSPVIPCLTQGISAFLPRINSAFRDNRINASINFGFRQSPAYKVLNAPRVPSLADGSGVLAPTCQTLPDTPYDNDNPAPGTPIELLNKFGIGDQYDKSTVQDPTRSASATGALLTGDDASGLVD